MKSMVVLVKITVTGKTSGWKHPYYITDKGIYFQVSDTRAVKMNCTIGQLENRIATMYGNDWIVSYEGGFIAENVMKEIDEIRRNEI